MGVEVVFEVGREGIVEVGGLGEDGHRCGFFVCD